MCNVRCAGRVKSGISRIATISLFVGHFQFYLWLNVENEKMSGVMYDDVILMAEKVAITRLV